MLPNVEKKHCLPKLNGYKIDIEENIDTKDRGLAQTEKESREVFIILSMIIVLLGIMLLGYCIYKGMM